MELFSDSLRDTTHNSALRPVSALVSHGTTKIMPDPNAGIVWLNINQDTEASTIILSEPMLDVSKLEAVPEALITFALRVKTRPWPTSRFTTVTVHHFDVIFGYDCLANAVGTRTQRLSPWAVIGKQRRRPSGQRLAGHSEDADIPVHSCADLRPVLRRDDKKTYDIPPEIYGKSVPVFLIRRLEVSIQDCATSKGVFHAIKIGPGVDDMVQI